MTAIRKVLPIFAHLRESGADLCLLSGKTVLIYARFQGKTADYSPLSGVLAVIS